MYKSRRARRMERHHKSRETPAINLVSLMDIFTILVFFLLVNSSNPEQLSNGKALKLPSSSAETLPEETVVITITTNDLLVQGRKVASITEALAEEGDTVSALKDELLFIAGNGFEDIGLNREAIDNPITIMGDENTSYELIRKILMTCRQSSFTRIAFATTQKLDAAGPMNGQDSI